MNETDILNGHKTKPFDNIDIHLIDFNKNLSIGPRIDLKSNREDESNDTSLFLQNGSADPFNGRKNRNMNHQANEIEDGSSSTDVKIDSNTSEMRNQSQEPKLEATDVATIEQKPPYILVKSLDSSEFTRDNFNLSFEFKTDQEDGFFFLIPGKIYSKLNSEPLYHGGERDYSNNAPPLHFLVVSLKSGQLVVQLVEPKKPILLFLGHNLGDGKWHIVVFKKTAKHFTIFTDNGNEVLIDLNTEKRFKLPFEPSILIGGSISSLGNNSTNVFDSTFGNKAWTSQSLVIYEMMAHKFEGCLRYFKVNGKNVNLITEGTSLNVNCNRLTFQ